MKKNIKTILIICLLAVLLSACATRLTQKTADLVVFGTIYTAEDKNDGMAEAFAVKDGKYIYVGNREGAKKYIQEGKTQVLDRTGLGLIIPGCTEGHSHYFDGTGLNTQLPGSGCSYDEVLKILKDRVETKGIKQFVSFGWNSYELIEKRKSGFNIAQEIESIAPGIPVVLIDNSGHGAVCNTTALREAGILDYPQVRGGKVELDKDGNPNGFVGDQAVFYVSDRVIQSLLSEEQYKNACIYGMNKLLELGYTNALDAFTNMYNSVGLYNALKKMDDAGELKINVAVNCGWLSEVSDGFDLYEYLIGPERAKNLYPGDKLIHQGIKAAISTDRPCAEGPIDIFDYMATIVLGYDSGLGNQMPRRDVNLSVGDAIDMLTINGAWMANNEKERGSIEVGKYADFIFADFSPFACSPKLIRNIEVVSTCFEGKFVYGTF